MNNIYKPRSPKTAEHVVVYRNDHEFCAWPFNGGLWQFADGEIAAGFFRGPCDYKTSGSASHGTVDREHVMARSRDGGRTWPAELLTPSFNQAEMADTLSDTSRCIAPETAYDPHADGYCLMSGFGFPPADAPHRAYACVSTDRGRTWNAPSRLPGGLIRTTGFQYLASRPSYIVRNDSMLLLFAHGLRGPLEKEDLFHAETSRSQGVVMGSWDGGASWGIVGEISPDSQPCGVILPYPLLLGDGTILVAARRQYDGYNANTTIHESTDGGRTWRFISRANDWGAPANLVELPDGRIVCVYGYRQKPWGIRARVSADRGRTWGEEIVLRDDGGSWDVGYPRTILSSDGALVTVYYINRKDDSIQHDGGVRHIAATIWHPGA